MRFSTHYCTVIFEIRTTGITVLGHANKHRL